MTEFKKKLSKVLDLTRELCEISDHLLGSDSLEEDKLRRFDELLSLREKIIKELGKLDERTSKDVENLRVEIEKYEKKLVGKLNEIMKVMMNIMERNSKVLNIMRKYRSAFGSSNKPYRKKFDREA